MTVVRRLALSGLLAAGTLNAQQRGDSATSVIRKRTTAEDLQMFSQVLNQIRINHPDSLDTHELLMAAVRGMVGAADPHSYVIRSVQLDPEHERLWRDGKLYPLPVEFRFVDGAPIVASVSSGSRAAALDILPGDELVAVDGRSVRATSPMELEIMFSGKKHTTATLSFARRRPDGSLARLDRVVRRERVEEETAVPAAFMLDAITGFVRITTFAAENVADDLHAAVERLEKRGMQRLLLDLRDNGGGRVDQAAKVAGEFLPSGTVVYTSAGRRKESQKTGTVTRSFWRSGRSYPLVVLVNAGTASASELVAGALQDHDRAVIVGRPTFGKSLLMQSFPMSDGSTFALVIGHVKTPCGRVVQREYRTTTNREYYRLARAERDTAGRASCKTTGGRTVYGGGGIYPDIVLREQADPPLWLQRVREEDLTSKWVPGWLTANPAVAASIEVLSAPGAIPSAAVSAFRAFVQSQGLAIPEGAEADARIQRALRSSAAFTKFGESGFLQVTMPDDAEVQRAVETFTRAASILGR